MYIVKPKEYFFMFFPLNPLWFGPMDIVITLHFISLTIPPLLTPFLVSKTQTLQKTRKAESRKPENQKSGTGKVKTGKAGKVETRKASRKAESRNAEVVQMS